MKSNGYPYLPATYNDSSSTQRITQPNSVQGLGGVRLLPEMKLRQLAVALDDTNPEGLDYWRLFIDRLPIGTYSKVEVEKIAQESLINHSPSLRLLLDVQRRELVPTLEDFVYIVRSIGCNRAYNLFLSKSPVIISQQPMGGTYQAGSMVQLTCEARCQPGDPLYQWFVFSGNEPNPLVGATRRTLLFKHIGVEHTGSYCCRVTNPYMEPTDVGQCVFSKWATVKVAGMPVIKVQPHPQQEVHINEDLILTCEAESHPQGPTYQWYKDDKVLIGHTKSKLKYPIRTFEDKGLYYCIVSNPHLKDSAVRSNTCMARVLSPATRTEDPVVEVSPPGTVLGGFRNTSEDALFEPIPETSPCNPREGFRGKETLDGIGNIPLNSVPLDPGSFTTSEYNDPQPRTPESGVTLSEQVSINVSIHFTQEPGHKTVLPKTPFTVSCKAVSLTSSRIEYQLFERKNNTEKQLTERNETGELECSGLEVPKGSEMTHKLFVRAFVYEHAEEEPSHKDSEDFEVRVCKAYFVAEPIKTVRGISGEAAMFMCRLITYGSPQKLSYQWLKGETLIEEQNLEGETSNILTLKNISPEDRGKYTCKVTCTGTRSWSDMKYCHVELLVDERELDSQATIHILEHPKDCTLTMGGRMELFACAMVDTGDPLTFKWFRGAELVGEGPVLQVDSVSPLDEGRYHCEVSTSRSVKGTTKSADVKVKVPHASKITDSKKAEVYIPGKLRGKVALLIANQDYVHSSIVKLRTAEEDVLKVANRLKSLGFKVVTLANLSLIEMQEAETVFCRHLIPLEAAGILALVYFAGHGFSDGGKEYLMPVSAKKPDYHTTICREQYCAQLKESPQLAKLIRISDCCRTLLASERSPHPKRKESGYYNYVDITGCAFSQPAYEEFLANTIVTVLDKKPLTIGKLINGIQKMAAIRSENQRPMVSGHILEQDNIHFDDVVDELAYKDFVTSEDDSWKKNWDLLNPSNLPKDKILSLTKEGLKRKVKVKLTVQERFSNVVRVNVASECVTDDESGVPLVRIDRKRLENQKLKLSECEQSEGPKDAVTITNLQCLKIPMTLDISVKYGEVEEILSLSGCQYLYSALSSSRT